MEVLKTKVNIGDVFKINGGGCCTVVKYKNNRSVKIMFNDAFKYVKKVALHDLRKGNVKNPYAVNVMGVGYIGVGKNLPYKNGKESKSYITWVNMLRRCYGENNKGRNVTYKECEVSDDFLCYQNFASWYYAQKGCDKGFQLDKDLLLKGNKVYSSETCCLIPREVNNAISYKYKKGDLPTGVSKRSENRFRACINMFGKNRIIGTFDTISEADKAYKNAKEGYVRELAEIWKEDIDTKAYEALKGWEVV